MTYRQLKLEAERYLLVLREEAGEIAVGGITADELQEAFDDFLQSDDKVLKHENDAKAERSVRKQKYLLLSEMMRRTYLGFLAHPKFGEDAPVLSRLGKVRKSERKTGLTRKRKEEEQDPGGSEE